MNNEETVVKKKEDSTIENPLLNTPEIEEIEDVKISSKTKLEDNSMIEEGPLSITPGRHKKEDQDIILKNELKDEGMVCDLESKIEIEEDITLKAESSDLSEFIQETNNDSMDVKTGHVGDDESRRKEEEEEFSNRVTMEEFLPHLSGCQEYLYYREEFSMLLDHD